MAEDDDSKIEVLDNAKFWVDKKGREIEFEVKTYIGEAYGNIYSIARTTLNTDAATKEPRPAENSRPLCSACQGNSAVDGLPCNHCRGTCLEPERARDDEAEWDAECRSEKALNTKEENRW